MVLILCVCLQGLLVAPAHYGLPISMLEAPEAESDSLEFDEDLVFVALGGIAYGSALVSKPKKTRLELESASLLPDFPPPR